MWWWPQTRRRSATAAAGCTASRPRWLGPAHTARHVNQRTLNSRLFGYMAPYDEAINICQALEDTARHVIQGTLNPRLLRYMKSFDVAINTC
jgi:hypothetical protein